MRLGDLDALKEKINAFYDKLFVGCVSSDLITYASGVDKIIDNAPTVEYPFYQEAYQTGYEEGKNERPQGEWITNREHIDKELNGHYEGSCFNSPYNCSCCGYSPEDIRPNFCPNCGADMRKAVRNE